MRLFPFRSLPTASEFNAHQIFNSFDSVHDRTCCCLGWDGDVTQANVEEGEMLHYVALHDVQLSSYGYRCCTIRCTISHNVSFFLSFSLIPYLKNAFNDILLQLFFI